MEAGRKQRVSSRLRFAALVVVFLAAYWWMSRPVESAVTWKTDFDAAVAEARARGLPLFVDFYADWCGPCKALDAQVLSSQEVAGVMHKRFVPVRIDLTNRGGNSANERVAEYYGVRGIPTLLIVDPESRRIIARAGGDAFDVQGMLAFLDEYGG